MKYAYKNFATGRTTFTRGTFIAWTLAQGPLNARYAHFQNPRGSVFVPEYSLFSEAKKAIRAICYCNSEITKIRKQALCDNCQDAYAAVDPFTTAAPCWMRAGEVRG